MPTEMYYCDYYCGNCKKHYVLLDNFILKKCEKCGQLLIAVWWVFLEIQRHKIQEFLSILTIIYPVSGNCW